MIAFLFFACLFIFCFYKLVVFLGKREQEYEKKLNNKPKKQKKKSESSPSILYNILKVMGQIEFNSSSGFSSSASEYGSYVIQYRKSGSWWDLNGSNDEAQAERMFDQFVQNDPRASSTRCRLVRKVDGKVVRVVANY